MIILFFAAIELDGDETGRRLSFTYPEFIFCFSVFNGYFLYVAVDYPAAFPVIANTGNFFFQRYGSFYMSGYF